MKSITHKQIIGQGIKSVVIMPTYGTPSWFYRGKVGLPFIIDREQAGGHYESETSFFKRAKDKEDYIRVKISKCAKGSGVKEYLFSGIWLKYNDLKPKVIRHDYVVKSKVNKKKKRY